MKVADKSNESINSIEEAITKHFFKYYDYKHFSNIEEIGTPGGFGKVYRAKWKNSYKPLALKSFFNFNDTTIKEIIHELKLQRDVYFHDNVIRFYGITQENQNDPLKNYLLVMEYADGGTLQNYLKKCFSKLTWSDKFNLALQLACAVSCLHDEDIVHRDLHPGNVLVQQNAIKLADFGLSKRIEIASNTSGLGIIPYIDPKRFIRRRNRNSQSEISPLNDKRGDVYSVGMIFWEISSGKPPFYTEGESYDVELAVEISQGLKETIVPNTPADYAKLYAECWDNEPNNRPTINQVVERLRSMISALNNDQTVNRNANRNANLQSPKVQQFSSIKSETLSSFQSPKVQQFSSIKSETLSSLQSPKVQQFNSIKNETPSSLQSPKVQQFNSIKNEIPLSFQSPKVQQFGSINNETPSSLQSPKLQQFSSINNETPSSTNNYPPPQSIWSFVKPLSNKKNDLLENKFNKMVVQIIDIITSKLDNEGKSDKVSQSILDHFEKHRIDPKEFCNWILNNQNNSKSIFILGYFNYCGFSEINENEFKAFKLFFNALEQNHILAQLFVGECYQHGRGTMKNENLAFRYYEKVAGRGYKAGEYKTGYFYHHGIGIKKDPKLAISWYEKAASNGNLAAMNNLGMIYKKGDEGVDKNYNKAIEFLETAATLGYGIAQYNLANMYNEGVGVKKDVNQAICWYRKAANQGVQQAQNKLEKGSIE